MEKGVEITKYIHSIEKDPMTYIERNIQPERVERLKNFIAAHGLTGKERRLDVYVGHRTETKKPIYELSLEFEGYSEALKIQVEPEEMKGQAA